MPTMKYFMRSSRGSAITEFAFSSIIMILVLMMTLEFGVEVFLRQQVESASGAAAKAYSETRSPQAAQDAAQAIMLQGFRDCLEPLDINIHNNISSLKNGSGRQAAGNSSDNGAEIAQVTLTCNWERLTPGSRMVLGESIQHVSSTYVRIRE